jgi:hypothetical protein
MSASTAGPPDNEVNRIDVPLINVRSGNELAVTVVNPPISDPKTTKSDPGEMPVV